MEKVNTLIIGASAAGLSCAAQLRKRGIPFEIIEKATQVGNAWRHHYERLHLHTNKSSSNLPFVKFPKQVSRYPSRLEVISYLENYCRELQISPKFNTAATRVYKTDEGWITETENGEIHSENLIFCTGNTNIPRKITKRGLETFPGRVLHSSEYKNGKEFKGQKVLVIGFGNSACEIAICLHEHGAIPSMSVRSPVNVIPRDILGIPVLKLGILMSNLPPSIADRMNKPLMDVLVGDIEQYGLKKLPYGPMEQIARDHSIPLLDIGTMDLIKEGKIKVHGDITLIEGKVVHFNEISEVFDAVIMATGYDTGLQQIIELDKNRTEELVLPVEKRRYFGKDHLYFCGFFVAPSGMLREIKLESEIIAKSIANKRSL
jgi:cation diffusion facilitator CzcD-associated flavoprotein CzcO